MSGGGAGSFLSKKPACSIFHTNVSRRLLSDTSISINLHQSSGRNCYIKNLGCSKDLCVVKYQAVPNNRYLRSGQGEIAIKSNFEILNN